jgi:MoaA/NifB/PqqE/SkfB family radical SAM enzyme
MDRLKKRGIVFGASVTVTRYNAEELFYNDVFVNHLINKGVTYLWAFHYIPIGSKPNLEMMITPEQRAVLAKRVPVMRNTKPLFIADFWNDGTYTDGCIAGGRRYFHINSKGDVEPCAFVHFAADNIKGKSLKEVLQNPLFKSYQKRQPFNDNLLLPCPIIDNPTALREMVNESGAYPTHSGAETVLEGEVAKKLDTLSEEWGKISGPIFLERLGKGEHEEKAQ